jgi:queuine/archaeosine tRNA-ribosyltransferase
MEGMARKASQSGQILFRADDARVLLFKGRTDLITPTYFPAISGTGTNAPPLDLIGLVSTSSYPRMLVSAYDLVKMSKKESKRARDLISQFRKTGGTLLMDSGSFESFWFRDRSWTFAAYAQFVRGFRTDLYCSFDRYDLWSGTRKEPFSEQLRLAGLSAKLIPTSTCALIVRGPVPSRLLDAVSRLVEQSPVSVSALAIAERECGGNLLARAETVSRVRAILDEESDRILLHLLGCGSPLSLAVYASCGADSFDSQDWSQLAVDRSTIGFVDPAHLQLLNCKCGVCKKVRVDNYQRTLLHNLLFYQEYVLDLQRMIRENTLKDFLMARVPKTFYERLEKSRARTKASKSSKDKGGP